MLAPAKGNWLLISITFPFTNPVGSAFITDKNNNNEMRVLINILMRK